MLCSEPPEIAAEMRTLRLGLNCHSGYAGRFRQSSRLNVGHLRNLNARQGRRGKIGAP